MSYNRCNDTRKFGNKYLPLAYKTQVDFRSHFLGKKSSSYSPRNTVLISSELFMCYSLMFHMHLKIDVPIPCSKVFYGLSTYMKTCKFIACVVGK